MNKRLAERRCQEILLRVKQNHTKGKNGHSSIPILIPPEPLGRVSSTPKGVQGQGLPFPGISLGLRQGGEQVRVFKGITATTKASPVLPRPPRCWDEGQHHPKAFGPVDDATGICGRLVQSECFHSCSEVSGRRSQAL